jgi:membrane-associated phospholipid phosphatase
MTSAAYATAYNEVKQVGGDGVTTPTARNLNQTQAGLFWGYDGTAGLGTPPRIFNQIAVQIAALKLSSAIQLARLLALLNTGIADAGLAAWTTKYHYQYWRPITGIREADPGTGPTGLGDNNPGTTGDRRWTPMGAQASNLPGVVNFTPPFPSYSSGHANFAGCAFQMLRRFYGTDLVPFAFISDELNGTTRDNRGRVRPLVPRTFLSRSAAEEDCGQSRIYLGIHWAFDKTQGIAKGRALADYVFAHSFQPVR